MSKPYLVTRKITVDAGHRVPNHGSKCKNLHGHTYTVLATFSSPSLDQEDGSSSAGMVADFGCMKTLMHEAIHDHCDHATIMYCGDPMLEALLGGIVHTRLQNAIFENVGSCVNQSIALHDSEGGIYTSTAVVNTAMRLLHTQAESSVYINAPSSANYEHSAFETLRNVVDEMRFAGEDAEQCDVSFKLYPHGMRLLGWGDQLSNSTYLDAVSIKGVCDTNLYVVGFIPTAENLARHWFQRLERSLTHCEEARDSVKVEKIVVWETPNCSAEYGS